MRNNKAASLFPKELVIESIKQSFVKLDPRVMFRNPIMFIVEIVTFVMLAVTLRAAATGDTTQGSFGYNSLVFLVLAATLLFANFAEAIAEARGKAQADSLRKTREETPAKVCVGDRMETVSSSRLQKGDVFICEAGDNDNSLQFNVSADLVSSYVWRGLCQTGASIQPTFGLSAGGFSFTAWGSTDFDGNASMTDAGGNAVAVNAAKEIDLTAAYTFGNLGLTLSLASTGSSPAGFPLAGIRHGHPRPFFFHAKKISRKTEAFHKGEKAKRIKKTGQLLRIRPEIVICL